MSSVRTLLCSSVPEYERGACTHPAISAHSEFTGGWVKVRRENINRIVSSCRGDCAFSGAD
jgi:hypothetical protein